MPEHNPQVWEQEGPFLLHESGVAERELDRQFPVGDTFITAPKQDAPESQRSATDESFESSAPLASTGPTGLASGIQPALSPEPSHLTADEITMIFGRMPATAALSSWLASPELRQAMAAALLAEPGARRSIRIHDTDMTVPGYLRLLSRLFGEAAEQSVAEAIGETAGSGQTESDGPPALLCVLPSTFFRELTEFARPVSMGLTSDPRATLSAPADLGSPVSTSLSFPQGWTGNLLIDYTGAQASGIRFPVTMTHGGHTHVMPAAVFSTLVWKDLAVRVPGATGGSDISLPLSRRFILGSTSSSGRLTRIAAGTVDTFPLHTDVQTYATVVFGYSVDGQTRSVVPLDFCTLRSGQLTEWLANHGSPDPTSSSKTAVIAVYELALCGPRDDYQPKDGAPTGAAQVVRAYPLLSVWSSRPLKLATAVLDIARPATTPMEGMAGGGAISAALYADMNSVVRSLWDELHHDLKKALQESRAAMKLLGLGHVLAADLVSLLKGVPSTRWDSLFAHYSLNATRSNLTVVAPGFSRRSNSTDRQVWDRSKSRYVTSAVSVEKLERQGSFDNVHIAPAMDYQGAAAIMAPLCHHDCLHIHWRWGAAFTDKPMRGWSGGKPYQKPGAPMIPENQTLRISLGGPNLSYAPMAHNTPARTWQIFMHHGTGYVSALTLVGEGVRVIELAQLTGLPRWEGFYYHNRMWETRGSRRAADKPRLNEAGFGPLETM